MADTLTPERAAERLCELSTDVRAAVLLDAAGSLESSSEDDRSRAQALADLARNLFEEVDRATRDWDTEPPEQVVEHQRGGRGALRRARHRGARGGGAADAGAGRPVKEKRKGPLSRAAGLAEGMAATVRRMQREREPRVLVYDPAGYARLLQPEARGQARIMELAEEMLSLVAERE
jgi:hypothetical protein